MSVIINPEKNKSALLKQLNKAQKGLSNTNSDLLFKRFLKFEEDKKRINEIKKHIKESESIMEELYHILVHDSYYAKIRK